MMRTPILRLLNDDEIIVDAFAGGGGASLGIEIALGRSPDVAVNHDPEAIAMHQANHPKTEHYIEDIYDVDPVAVCRGKRVGLAWFSPDCVEHSRAKNGALVRNKKVRCLANVVHRWAADVRPRVILLENVTEWEDWGPLGEDGKIDKTRKGESFQFWWERLEHMGYRLSKRELKACDYGAPTSRNRLYVIARCDGIDPEDSWPEPTHGPGLLPYRTAAECIDYSLPCPSIFMTKAEARAYRKEAGIACKRPLAPKTMLRIRRGIYKYVLRNARPFIVPVSHGGVGRTDHRVHDTAEPLRTVTGAARGELALVAPTLVQTGYGERPGQLPRCLDLHAPLGTVVSGGTGGTGKHALVAAFLSKGYSERTTGGWNGGQAVDVPMSSVTCRDHHNLAVVKLGDAATTNMVDQVRAFLTRFGGFERGGGQVLDDPMLTVTTKDRFGLVTVQGTEYQIVDIGMRMLEPRELFRAQGFPDSYIIDPHFTYTYTRLIKRTGRTVTRTVTKPLTETAQVDKCGNSVSPPVATALVRAVFSAAARAVPAAA